MRHLLSQWRTAARDGQIARGIFIGSPKLDWPTFERFKAGRETVEDIKSLVYNPVGEWWGWLGRDFGLEDIKDFGSGGYGSEELLLLPHNIEYVEDQHAQGDTSYVWGQVEIALVAERPPGWDPETGAENLAYSDRNPLMGNSFVPVGTPLTVVEVHYNAGRGWKAMPCRWQVRA